MSSISTAPSQYPNMINKADDPLMAFQNGDLRTIYTIGDQIRITSEDGDTAVLRITKIKIFHWRSDQNPIMTCIVVDSSSTARMMAGNVVILNGVLTEVYLSWDPKNQNQLIRDNIVDKIYIQDELVDASYKVELYLQHKFVKYIRDTAKKLEFLNSNEVNRYMGGIQIFRNYDGIYRFRPENQVDNRLGNNQSKFFVPIQSVVNGNTCAVFFKETRITDYNLERTSDTVLRINLDDEGHGPILRSFEATGVWNETNNRIKAFTYTSEDGYEIPGGIYNPLLKSGLAKPNNIVMEKQGKWEETRHFVGIQEYKHVRVTVIHEKKRKQYYRLIDVGANYYSNKKLLYWIRRLFYRDYYLTKIFGWVYGWVNPNQEKLKYSPDENYGWYSMLPRFVQNKKRLDIESMYFYSDSMSEHMIFGKNTHQVSDTYAYKTGKLLKTENLAFVINYDFEISYTEADLSYEVKEANPSAIEFEFNTIYKDSEDGLTYVEESPSNVFTPFRIKKVCGIKNFFYIIASKLTNMKKPWRYINNNIRKIKIVNQNSMRDFLRVTSLKIGEPDLQQSKEYNKYNLTITPRDTGLFHIAIHKWLKLNNYDANDKFYIFVYKRNLAPNQIKAKVTVETPVYASHGVDFKEVSMHRITLPSKYFRTRLYPRNIYPSLYMATNNDKITPDELRKSGHNNEMELLVDLRKRIKIFVNTQNDIGTFKFPNNITVRFNGFTNSNKNVVAELKAFANIRRYRFLLKEGRIAQSDPPMETNDIMFKPNVTRNVLKDTKLRNKYNSSNIEGEDVGFVSIAAAVLRKHVQLYLDKNVPDEENKLGKGTVYTLLADIEERKDTFLNETMKNSYIFDSIKLSINNGNTTPATLYYSDVVTNKDIFDTECIVRNAFFANGFIKNDEKVVNLYPGDVHITIRMKDENEIEKWLARRFKINMTYKNNYIEYPHTVTYNNQQKKRSEIYLAHTQFLNIMSRLGKLNKFNTTSVMSSMYEPEIENFQLKQRVEDYTEVGLLGSIDIATNDFEKRQQRDDNNNNRRKRIKIQEEHICVRCTEPGANCYLSNCDKPHMYHYKCLFDKLNAEAAQKEDRFYLIRKDFRTNDRYQESQYYTSKQGETFTKDSVTAAGINIPHTNGKVTLETLIESRKQRGNVKDKYYIDENVLAHGNLIYNQGNYYVYGLNMKCDACSYPICPSYKMVDSKKVFRDFDTSVLDTHYMCKVDPTYNWDDSTRRTGALIVLNDDSAWVKLKQMYNNDTCFNVPMSMNKDYYIEDKLNLFDKRKIMLPDPLDFSKTLKIDEFQTFYEATKRYCEISMEKYTSKLKHQAEMREIRMKNRPQCWNFDIIGCGNIKMYEKNGNKVTIENEKKLEKMEKRMKELEDKMDLTNELLFSKESRQKYRFTHSNETHIQELNKEKTDIANEYNTIIQKIKEMQVEETSYLNKNSIGDLLERIESTDFFKKENGRGKVNRLINMTIGQSGSVYRYEDPYKANIELRKPLKDFFKPFGETKSLWPNKETKIRLLPQRMSDRMQNDVETILVNLCFKNASDKNYDKKHGWFISVNKRDFIDMTQINNSPWAQDFYNETGLTSDMISKFERSNFENFNVYSPNNAKDPPLNARSFLQKDSTLGYNLNTWHSAFDMHSIYYEPSTIEEDDDLNDVIAERFGESSTRNYIEIVFEKLDFDKLPDWFKKSYENVSYMGFISDWIKDRESIPVEVLIGNGGGEWENPKGTIVPKMIMEPGRAYRKEETREILWKMTYGKTPKALIAEFYEIESGNHVQTLGCWMEEEYKHGYWATKVSSDPQDNRYEEEAVFDRFKTPLKFLPPLITKKDMLFSGINVLKKVSQREKDFLAYMRAKHKYRLLVDDVDFEMGGKLGLGWCDPEELFDDEYIFEAVKDETPQDERDRINYRHICELKRPNIGAVMPDMHGLRIQLSVIHDDSRPNLMNMCIVNVNSELTAKEKLNGEQLADGIISMLQDRQSESRDEVLKTTMKPIWKQRILLPEHEYHVLKVKDELKEDKYVYDYMSMMTQNLINTVWAESKGESGAREINFPDENPFNTADNTRHGKMIGDVDLHAIATVNRDDEYTLLMLTPNRSVIIDGVKIENVNPNSIIFKTNVAYNDQPVNDFSTGNGYNWSVKYYNVNNEIVIIYHGSLEKNNENYFINGAENDDAPLKLIQASVNNVKIMPTRVSNRTEEEKRIDEFFSIMDYEENSIISYSYVAANKNSSIVNNASWVYRWENSNSYIYDVLTGQEGYPKVYAFISGNYEFTGAEARDSYVSSVESMSQLGSSDESSSGSLDYLMDLMKLKF